MQRTLCIVVSLAAVAALTVMPAVAGRGKGAAEKATGGLVIQEHNGREAKVEFNAHEQRGAGQKAGDKAKGALTWSLLNADGEVIRNIVLDVSIVKVDGDTAWFAGEAVEDSNDDAKVGDWLYVMVIDYGTPGTNGDTIGWKWVGTLAAAQMAVDNEDDDVNDKPILEGNLVVHTK
ncbi:MAG: hypothetical protein ACOC95_04435 [Planctomycetota bacterium]